MGLKYGRGVDVGARLLGWWPAGPVTSCVDLFSIVFYCGVTD